MTDSRNKPELETLSYIPCQALECSKCGKTFSGFMLKEFVFHIENCSYKPPSAPRAAGGNNTPVIKPETRVTKAEDAEQPFKPIEFPEMCKDTKLIIKACKQVIQSAEDYETDTMTTPITVVQACEQLNYLLEDIRNNKAGIPACVKSTEQPNQNLMIIEEIEGLMSQANEKMYDLPIHPVRSTAIEEIDILLRITIKKQLREAFE